jgi:hypothetical protein
LKDLLQSEAPQDVQRLLLPGVLRVERDAEGTRQFARKPRELRVTKLAK